MSEEDWSYDMNDTELTYIAQSFDPEAHRGLPRKHLIEIIQGAASELPVRLVNKARGEIMDFILKHWEQVKPLISCPAKSKNPRACYSCTDVQVTECAYLNKDIVLEKGSI